MVSENLIKCPTVWSPNPLFCKNGATCTSETKASCQRNGIPEWCLGTQLVFCTGCFCIPIVGDLQSFGFRKKWVGDAPQKLGHLNPKFDHLPSFSDAEVSGSLSDWGINCGIWAVNRTGLLSFSLRPGIWEGIISWWVASRSVSNLGRTLGRLRFSVVVLGNSYRKSACRICGFKMKHVINWFPHSFH